MIKCPNCGTTNPVNNKFCGECGTKLPPIKNYCPECNREFIYGEKFCTVCGTKLVNRLEFFKPVEEKSKLDLAVEKILKKKEEEEKNQLARKRQWELNRKKDLENHRHQKLLNKQGTKKCPFCHETILKNAIRCKYCKQMLKT